MAVFSRMGVRTRQEIDGEKQALKAVGGDLDELISSRSPTMVG